MASPSSSLRFVASRNVVTRGSRPWLLAWLLGLVATTAPGCLMSFDASTLEDVYGVVFPDVPTYQMQSRVDAYLATIAPALERSRGSPRVIGPIALPESEENAIEGYTTTAVLIWFEDHQSFVRFVISPEALSALARHEGRALEPSGTEWEALLADPRLADLITADGPSGLAGDGGGPRAAH